MNNIIVTMMYDFRGLILQSKDKIIGTVMRTPEGEPEIHIVTPTVLTFGDLEIIRDNWNQLMEMEK